MGKVILFPCRVEPEVEEIDLLTAVDVAIRDLRDIARQIGELPARKQADECRQMLELAFAAALLDN
jgi:hypothetical protein